MSVSLHKPFFYLRTSSTEITAHHNYHGELDFCASSKPLDAETVRLIELALEEGKRRRSREIAELLQGDK